MTKQPATLDSLAKSVEDLTGTVEDLTKKFDSLTGTVEDLTGTVEGLTKKFDSLAKSVEDLTTTVGDLAQMMSDGFTSLNARMDSLEERMDRLEGRMDKIESRMDQLEKSSREHTTAILGLTERIDNLELHLGGLDDDVKYLYGLIEKLKKDMKSGKLSDEETRSRLEEVEAIAKQLSIRVGLKT